MKHTDIQHLAPEVRESLQAYNTAIDNALGAVQKLEAICITKRLAEMFWTQDQQVAEMIREDYIVGV